MRPPSRIRRIAKWTGVALCVLILASWGLSLWYAAEIPLGTRGWIENQPGSLKIGVLDGSYHPTAGVYEWAEWYGTGLEWPGMYTEADFFTFLIFVPFWLLLLAVTISTAILFYRDRHMPLGHCTKCGYDLTGNVSGVCPECGLKIGAASGPAAG